MKNYFILHGSFSSPFSNWIPWLRKELEEEDAIVYTPDLPTGVGYQNYENWKSIMMVYYKAGLINKNTIIFAHSIAPVFISKFIIENKIRVKRLVFICGFNNYFGINEEYDAVNGSMYSDGLAEIKKYCDEIECFYSDNDPYVKYDVEKSFANEVGGVHHCIPGGGHLNSEFNYQEFKELLEYK